MKVLRHRISIRKDKNHFFPRVLSEHCFELFDVYHFWKNIDPIDPKSSFEAI